jgi:hypothetical protein
MDFSTADISINALSGWGFIFTLNSHFADHGFSNERINALSGWGFISTHQFRLLKF